MNLCSKYRPSCTNCTGHHPPTSNLSLYVMPPTGLYAMVSYDAIFRTKAMQSCFPVSGPTSHLKMTRPPGFFFFFFFSETKVERKWCTNHKMHRGE